MSEPPGPSIEKITGPGPIFVFAIGHKRLPHAGGGQVVLKDAEQVTVRTELAVSVYCAKMNPPNSMLAVKPKELVSVAATLKADVKGPGASGPGADTIPASSCGEESIAPMFANSISSTAIRVVYRFHRKADSLDLYVVEHASESPNGRPEIG